MPADHLLKFVYALSDVHREGDVPLVCGGEAVAKKLVRAVLDLHRRDHAGEQPGGVSGQPVDQLERRLKAFAALLFVPVEPEHMIVFELPARRGEAGRQEAADVRSSQRYRPSRARSADVAERR